MKTLIVIDMQNDFVTGALGSKEAVAILPNVKKKIEEYISAGHEVIFTRDTHGEGYLDTNEGKHLPSELQDSRKVEKVSTPLSALGLSLGASLGTLLDCEHIVNSYVLMIPRKEAISELEARQKKMNLF